MASTRSVTQRLFLAFSEVELCEDGVVVVSRDRDAVDAALRERTGRERAAGLWNASKRLKIAPETTHIIMRWSRVASMA